MTSQFEVSVDDLLPGEEMPQRVNPMIELGATGLKRNAGFINEEFLPQLKGRKAVAVYKEMADNDPMVGALLFSVDRLMREIDWRVEPADSTSDSKAAAEFVEQCMEDMSSTWDDVISEILSMLTFGWSWHEIVYKRRVGPWERDPKNRSKYTDNRIGWRKLPIRAQETLTRWVFDDNGGIKGMIQMPPPLYKQIPLPIEKSLLFRVSVSKGNPEGRSFLRNAYRPWYMKKRFEEIEAVGAERDLAGMPMARVPGDYLKAAQTNPQGDKAKMVEAFRTLVKSVRRNEQDGIIIPREFDPDTKADLFDFELLASSGSRQFDINQVITRYEERILMTVLADFILVGHQGTGSYSMHTDKTGLFRASMNSIAQSIADVFNRYAIPRLFEVNDWKLDQLPQIVPGDIDPPDLTQLSGFMAQLGSAGMQWFPDPELEKFLRQAARLPALDETAEKVKETEARQDSIMRLASQRMQMLQISQQAEQGALGLEQQKMGLDQTKQQLEQGQEQQNPEVQAAQDTQTVQSGELDLAAKEQAMRHTEEKHQLSMEQMKAQAKGEDPRFAEQKLKQGDDLHKEKVNQLKLQTKTQAEQSKIKLQQMKLKPKSDKPKEKK